MLRRHDAICQISDGANPLAPAPINTDPVGLPVQLVLIPDHLNFAQTVEVRGKGPGVSIGRDDVLPELWALTV